MPIEQSPHRAAGITFGIFFILAFLSYGAGAALIDSVTGTTDFLADIAANISQLVTGAMLIAIIHSIVNIGLPLIMLPILLPYSKRLTYGYLSAAIIATTILAVGAVFSLMLVPLGQEYLLADHASLPALDAIAAMFRAGGNIAYHLGMAIWAIGGLLFCAVLAKSGLLPRLFPLWGIFGYLVLTLGSISGLFGHNETIEIISVVPGGLFEITLSLWLIFKGFNRQSLPAPI